MELSIWNCVVCVCVCVLGEGGESECVCLSVCLYRTENRAQTAAPTAGPHPHPIPSPCELERQEPVTAAPGFHHSQRTVQPETARDGRHHAIPLQLPSSLARGDRQLAIFVTEKTLLPASIANTSHKSTAHGSQRRKLESTTPHSPQQSTQTPREMNISIKRPDSSAE